MKHKDTRTDRLRTIREERKTRNHIRHRSRKPRTQSQKEG
jgi:hypothetical protein